MRNVVRYFARFVLDSGLYPSLAAFALRRSTLWRWKYMGSSSRTASTPRDVHVRCRGVVHTRRPSQLHRLLCQQLATMAWLSIACYLHSL